MESHAIKVFGKSVTWTDKSMFRVEERKQPKGSYEGLYAHKDIHQAVNYFKNTKVKDGFLIRLVKDGDEFVVITKKS